MILQAFQKRLRRAFSHAAVNYDSLTTLHKEIGRELVRKAIMQDPCQCILDVGCGTGYITKKMKFFYPDAEIVGLDLSEGMLVQAQKIEEKIHWVQADAHHLPIKEKSADIIISNLSYQWVFDLPLAFQSSYRALNQDGIFCATLFGSRTFEELFESIQNACSGNATNNAPAIRRLHSLETVEQSIHRAQFKDIKINFELIKVEFQDLWDLLKWTKSIGANVLPRDGFIGRDLLERANEYYRKHFPYHDGVRATLEVIWIEGKK